MFAVVSTLSTTSRNQLSCRSKDVIKPAAHDSSYLVSKNSLVAIGVSMSSPCAATFRKFLFMRARLDRKLSIGEFTFYDAAGSTTRSEFQVRNASQ